MVNNQLVSYIKEYSAKGYSIKAIRASLRSQGFSAEDVEEAIVASQSLGGDMARGVKLTTWYISIPLLIIIIGLASFFVFRNANNFTKQTQKVIDDTIKIQEENKKINEAVKNPPLIETKKIESCGELKGTANYDLGADVRSSDGPCFKITEGKVDLDCHGHMIVGSIQIEWLTEEATVRNCLMSNGQITSLNKKVNLINNFISAPINSNAIQLNYSDYSTIENNTITECGASYGISISNSKNVRMPGNKIMGCQKAAIYLINSSDNIISGSELINNQTGIELIGKSLRGSSINNTFTSNKICGNLKRSAKCDTRQIDGGGNICEIGIDEQIKNCGITCALECKKI